jgi:hypothetical protein
LIVLLFESEARSSLNVTSEVYCPAFEGVACETFVQAHTWYHVDMAEVGSREVLFYLISVCTVVTVREVQKGLYRQFEKKSTNKSMFIHKVVLEVLNAC